MILGVPNLIETYYIKIANINKRQNQTGQTLFLISSTYFNIISYCHIILLHAREAGSPVKPDIRALTRHYHKQTD